MIPLVIVCGKAGSGKDTFGAELARQADGVCIGLADPMKRAMRTVFGFNDTQLYGPSEERDKIDPRYVRSESLAWDFHDCWNRLNGITPGLLRLFGNDVDPDEAKKRLQEWFADCKHQAMERGGLSTRYALQTFGTEWGRSLDPEVWSRACVNTARKLLGGEHRYSRDGGLVRDIERKRPPGIAVITDGRFGNEIINTKSAGGISVECVRPKAQNTATTGKAGHASEAGLDEVPSHYHDWRISNDSTLERFLEAAAYIGRSVIATSGRVSVSRFGHDWGGAVTRTKI
jgi:hypothetical protein